MYQTGNVDILTLKQLLGHSNVSTTQIYTHLQEFQVRTAIEENPLGKVVFKKANLDTTERKAGENVIENAAEAEESDEVSPKSSPMEPLKGSAGTGFGLRLDQDELPVRESTPDRQQDKQK